jgi:hypothetical protein
MDRNLVAGRLVSIVAVGCAVVVLVLAWHVSLKNKSIAAENALLKNALGNPFVIRDLELDVLPHMTAVAPSVMPQPSMAEKVMFVAREGCQYCEKQLPIWKNLVRSSVLEGGAEIWLISLGEGSKAFGDLAQTLTSQGRPYRKFRVDSIAAFALGTGIRGTPTTVITKDNRVRLVYAGLFSDPIRDEVFSGRLLAPSARGMFPSAGRTEPITR